jgi:hypothetical protein
VLRINAIFGSGVFDSPRGKFIKRCVKKPNKAAARDPPANNRHKTASNKLGRIVLTRLLIAQTSAVLRSTTLSAICIGDMFGLRRDWRLGMGLSFWLLVSCQESNDLPLEARFGLVVPTPL